MYITLDRLSVEQQKLSDRLQKAKKIKMKKKFLTLKLRMEIESVIVEYFSPPVFIFTGRELYRILIWSTVE